MSDLPRSQLLLEKQIKIKTETKDGWRYFSAKSVNSEELTITLAWDDKGGRESCPRHQVGRVVSHAAWAARSYLRLADLSALCPHSAQEHWNRKLVAWSLSDRQESV